MATVAGVGAMVPTPLSPILGGISFAAGLTTTGIAAYDACSTCTSDKGGCGAAILNAVAQGAFMLPGLATMGRGYRGSGARQCSFTGETTVLMADGTRKPIREVAVGDEVLATDPETGEQAAKVVEQVFVHWDTVADLVVDGELIATTEDHPFWSGAEHRFKRADQFRSGEQVVAADGRLLDVTSPALLSPRQAFAYNLSVEGIHTYHVGTQGILVHNTCAFPQRPLPRDEHGQPVPAHSARHKAWSKRVVPRG